MKTNLLFAAVMAVALSSSCSKNEVVENPIDPSNAIGFGTYVGTATKAAASTSIKTDFETNDVFVIDAYFTEDADFDTNTGTFAKFMQDQTVTKQSDDTWTYSPIKYWPNDDGDKVSFFAISNGNSTKFTDTAVSTTAGAEFTYNNATPGDLLVASLLNKTEQTENLKFNFKHALAMLEFNARTAADYSETDKTTITINSIKITGTSKFSNGGTFVFDPKVEGKVKCNPSTALAAGKEIADITTDQAITVDYLKDPFYGITIIPQGTANDAATATVDIVYTVKTVANSGGTSENDSSIENTATFKLDKVYSSNTKYTYNIIISLTDVKVEGSISTGWTDPTDTYYVDVETSTNSTVSTTDPSATESN